MLKAILTTSTGQILQTKEMVAINDFPPAVYLDGGLYLFLMLKTPTSAFYRETSYYLFDQTPIANDSTYPRTI